MTNRTVKTFCRNCSHLCGLELSIQGNEMVAVKGDTENRSSNGYHCIKAISSLDLGNGKTGRLTSCQKKQQDGSFSPIGAEQAQDEIANKLSTLIKQHGSRSVGVFYGTAAYYEGLNFPIMKSFLGELQSPNLFSTCTIDMSAVWVSPMRMGMMASGLPKMDQLETLLIAGKNPVVSHLLFGVYRPGTTLAQFKKEGRNLIIVDPRNTETARRATQHLAVKPGEDVPLFAAMIRTVIDNQWHDKEFCERFCINLEQLRASVDSYTPEAVEQRTGLNWSDIEQAAKTFASTRSFAVAGTGVTMAPHSNLIVHLVDSLNVICGNYPRAGDPVQSYSVLIPRPYTEAVIPPNRTWEKEPKILSSDTGAFYGEFPTGALPDEILCEDKERIRALIVYGGNPVKALGQPEKTLKAFKNLELLAVIDPMMNETAKLADYVIAPQLQYERHDITAVIDGVAAFASSFAQYTPPVITPPAGVIGSGEFFWGLAKRMGLKLEYKKLVFGMSYGDTPPGQPMDMEKMADGEQLARWWCEGSYTDFETLKAHTSGFSPSTTIKVAAAEDDGARLDLCPADVALELAETFHEKRSIAFPYRLTNRRLLECLNSMYHHVEATTKRYETNYAYMHPEDMAKHGLQDGNLITIESMKGGEIVGAVKADISLQSGMISMSHLWGEPDAPKSGNGSFTGALVSLELEDVEPINRMPRQTAIDVRIRRVSNA
ncbi:MAG: molybdopterin-dependent oxidoreductase [Porticoccaceae bacterium]|nr:molybdopterin-dependent oxidoreductase [Porticoccaceae bacterium]